MTSIPEYSVLSDTLIRCMSVICVMLSNLSISEYIHKGRLNRSNNSMILL